MDNIALAKIGSHKEELDYRINDALTKILPEFLTASENLLAKRGGKHFVGGQVCPTEFQKQMY